MEPDQRFKEVSLHRVAVTAQGRPEPGNEMPVTICFREIRRIGTRQEATSQERG